MLLAIYLCMYVYVYYIFLTKIKAEYHLQD